MTMRCKNGEAHTHETVAQAKACWLGGPASPVATLAQPVATRPNYKVADGRYAVTLPGEDTLRFFRVRNGHTKMFLDEQAGDDFFPVIPVQRRLAIALAINSDPAALARYGQELGVCGVCGRTLTDEASRAAGIGPVCAAK